MWLGCDRSVSYATTSRGAGPKRPSHGDGATRRGARGAAVSTKLLEAGRKGRDLGEALLELKLSPPQLRPGGMSRRQLIDTRVRAIAV